MALLAAFRRPREGDLRQRRCRELLHASAPNGEAVPWGHRLRGRRGCGGIGGRAVPGRGGWGGRGGGKRPPAGPPRGAPRKKPAGPPPDPASPRAPPPPPPA